MTYEWPLYFCLFLALWSAIVAGNFSAFSEFIMSALTKTEPAGGCCQTNVAGKGGGC